MRISTLSLAGFLSLSAMAAPALAVSAAGPSGALANSHADGLVVQIHNGSHRSCEVGPNGWHYVNRAGNRVACRPSRPSGLFWTWRSEGDRSGWYHRRDRRWN
jgi:hypothetical protein